MTDSQPPTDGSVQPASPIPDHGLSDPRAFAENAGVPFESRTFTHDTADHPEAGSAGLAVVGVTDRGGALLLLVQPSADHAVLPHVTVEPADDWAAAAREHVEALTGLDVAVDAVRRVRRVEHVVAGEDGPRETTHHVVLAGAVAGAAPTTTGLCEDNDWEVGWHRTPPVDLEAAARPGEQTAHDDVRLFLD